MPVRQKQIIQLTGFGVAIPPGVPYILNADGSPVGGGVGGTTQSHPSPTTGGHKIRLGLDGPMPEDATDGFIKTTGTMTQVAGGIQATLNAGNPGIEIDLPGIGPFTPNQVLVGVDIATATPGNGNHVGFRLDHNQAAYNFDACSLVDAGVWHMGFRQNAGAWSVGTIGGVALADIANIDFSYVGFNNAFNSVTSVNSVMVIGEEGKLNPLDSFGTGMGTFLTATPSTYDLILRAEWLSGDDMIVTFKYVAVVMPLQLSLVD